jgi:F1F0 ATPase subunit 2
MTTSDLPLLVLSLAIGGALGGVFFGGLWWTIRRALLAKTPAFWFCVSLMLRAGIVVAGFYFVAGAGFRPLLACLLGFATARFVVQRFVTKRLGWSKHLAVRQNPEEVRDAP